MIVLIVILQAIHYKKYSTASDVWSFGMVMYEIWSLGHKPFEDYTNTQVNKNQVSFCTSIVYMYNCFNLLHSYSVWKC